MGQEEHNLLDPAALLAQELYNLSFQEREQVFSDVHGVSDVVEETPEFVAGHLAELESALASIAGDSKPAYDQAKQQDPEFVSNRDFRLKFLRADNFDPPKAAQRMIKYLDAKLGIFGPERLTKKITLNDFTKEDLLVAQSGLGSILRLRDRAGRLVMCWMSMLRGESTFISRMRLVLYMCTLASEDEPTQKKGFTLILFNVGPNQKGDPTAAAKLVPLIGIMPVKVACVHYCYEPDDNMAAAITTFMKSADSQTRARFRIHCGDCQELHYQLMTFGIPTQLLPITDTCEINLEHVQLFLESKRSQEGCSSSMDSAKRHVIVPGPLDVLMGRDKLAQAHKGNVRFVFLIDTYQEKYEGVQRRDKKKIAREVVDEVKVAGGRFLDSDESGWEEVSNDIALEKACTAFRSRRKIQKRGERVQKRRESATRRRTQESLGSSVETIEDGSVSAEKNVMIRSSHMKRPKMDLLDDNYGRDDKGPIQSFWSL